MQRHRIWSAPELVWLATGLANPDLIGKLGVAASHSAINSAFFYEKVIKVKADVAAILHFFFRSIP